MILTNEILTNVKIFLHKTGCTRVKQINILYLLKQNNKQKRKNKYEKLQRNQQQRNH